MSAGGSQLVLGLEKSSAKAGLLKELTEKLGSCWLRLVCFRCWYVLGADEGPDREEGEQLWPCETQEERIGCPSPRGQNGVRPLEFTFS